VTAVWRFYQVELSGDAFVAQAKKCLCHLQGSGADALAKAYGCQVNVCPFLGRSENAG